MEENQPPGDDEIDELIEAVNDENSVGIPDKESYHRPLKRDPVTGKFIAGTGSRAYLGGRPKGAKDKVSRQMVDLATELIANRGQELFNEVADRDPAAALALVTKIISPEEMRQVFQEDRKGEGEKRDWTIQIGLTPAKPRQERLSAPEMPRVASTTDVSQTEAIPTPSVSANRSENPAPARARGPSPVYRRGGDRHVWEEESAADRDALRDLYTDDGIV